MATTTVKNKASIFTQAAVSAKSKKKTDDKEVVLVPKLAKAIEKYNSVKKQMAVLKSVLDAAEAEIHEQGEKSYLKLYQTQKHNPNSFILKADDAKRVMYVPQDKYKVIDQERVEYLNEKYDNVAEIITTYTFDNGMMELYGEVISDFVMGTKKIPDEDKSKLLVATVACRVKKGTIDRLLEADDIAEMYADIQNVTQLKNA